MSRSLSTGRRALLTAAMKDKGWTQSILADKIGCSQSTVSNMLSPAKAGTNVLDQFITKAEQLLIPSSVTETKRSIVRDLKSDFDTISADSSSGATVETKKGAKVSQKVGSSDEDGEQKKQKRAPCVRGGRADPHDDTISLSVGVLNTDWSNRDSTINSKDKLLKEVTRVVRNTGCLNSPDLLTFTEWNSIKWADELIDDDKYLTEYGARGFKASYDTVVSLWSTDRWEIDNGIDMIFSKLGKYQAIVVEERKTKQRVLHISTHLPHRQGKLKARTLLTKAIEELPDSINSGIDATCVSGDFNAGPTQVGTICTDMYVCFDNDKPTTQRGNRIDNVCVTDAVITRTPFVCDDYLKFSHYPIRTE